MFDVNNDESAPERELRMLKKWEEEGTFKKSLASRKGAKQFAICDGPPFATGLPHYGHLLAGTIKDVIPRYKTMKGFHVDRRFGWDCHGLPVESEIEKAHELSGATSIEAFGIAKFNDECRSIVQRYVSEWKSTVLRMGRWVDFDRTWKTMDKEYMESVWWVFKQVWDKGLIYQGNKVMPFSAKLGTPLSNFEANLNYKEVDDPSVVVRMPLVNDPNCALLIWTTTPWTLPSNAAVIVNPHIRYVRVREKESGEEFIFAKSRLKFMFKDPEAIEVVNEVEGRELVGTKYLPPFDDFVDELGPNAHQVLDDDFVGAEDGTGIVHAAPAFGEADFFVCTREQIEVICPIDQNGKFTDRLPKFEGMFVKDCDKEILRTLKQKGRVFNQATIRHRYPFCWRSDAPLLYKTVQTWFVSVEKIKEQILESNEQIHWVPDHLKHGRFGKWLENARDWAISRNRYWGTPIPVWKSDDDDMIAVGSIAELEELSGEKIVDLHRDYVDQITFVKNGKTYRRITEVFDCWFESGSAPYAQNHYPFENKELTEERFPADFIAEGLDQTRGWFYTLTVLGTALFGKPAFKNVVVNGIILASDGNKMSKRLKNYPEPEIVIDKYGADSVRLYFLQSPVVEADDLIFSEEKVELTMRQFLIPLWNSYVFFATYAKINGFVPKEKLTKRPEAEIDRWILSRLQKLISDVEKGLDTYHLSRAVEPFSSFIISLTNWYIRRCRSRFWSDQESQDRTEAFETLYYVLTNLVKIAAPFTPFMSEAIYTELKQEGDPESVHLCDFPVYDENFRDEALEEEMELTQVAVSIGHKLRKEHKQKVRQPLQTAWVISSDSGALESLKRQENLIKDELNVKSIEYLADESQFVTLTLKPNFRTVGKKVGKHMKAVKTLIENLDVKALDQLETTGRIELQVEGETFELDSDDIQVSRQVKEGLVAGVDRNVTLALDLTMNHALEIEGLAREIVNKINTMRRDAKFHVSDRVKVVMENSPLLEEAFTTHREYITREILATDFAFAVCAGEKWDLNGQKVVIQIEKVAAIKT
ncbi:MAG: Isoleucine--tRNA ligase [Chlamydiia bacterium]|nr:Isoleucine--tRNA ligase [Chlamydiia bacterium]